MDRVVLHEEELLTSQKVFWERCSKIYCVVVLVDPDVKSSNMCQEMSFMHLDPTVVL